MSTRRSLSLDTCPPTTTNCVSWQGPDIPCLGIETNCSITLIMETFATNICNLVGEVDMSSIILPACLVQAWGTKDPTILNFINLLLQESCTLQAEINTINSTLTGFNPLITVDFSCCSNNPCVVTGTVTLSQAIENIITCICGVINTNDNLQSQINDLTSSVNTLTNSVTTQQAQITTINANYTSLFSLVSALQGQVNCLNNNSGNLCP